MREANYQSSVVHRKWYWSCWVVSCFAWHTHLLLMQFPQQTIISLLQAELWLEEVKEVHSVVLADNYINKNSLVLSLISLCLMSRISEPWKRLLALKMSYHGQLNIHIFLLETGWGTDEEWRVLKNKWEGEGIQQKWGFFKFSLRKWKRGNLKTIQSRANKGGLLETL